MPLVHTVSGSTPHRRNFVMRHNLTTLQILLILPRARHVLEAMGQIRPHVIRDGPRRHPYQGLGRRPSVHLYFGTPYLYTVYRPR